MLNDECIRRTLLDLQRYADENGVCHRKNVGAMAMYHGSDIMAVRAVNSIPVECLDCRLVCSRGRGETRADDYSDCPARHAEVNLIDDIGSFVESVVESNGSGMNTPGEPVFDVFVSAPPCRSCLRSLLESKYVADIIWMRVGGRDDHVPEPESMRHGMREVFIESLDAMDE